MDKLKDLLKDEKDLELKKVKLDIELADKANRVSKDALSKQPSKDTLESD